MKKLVLALAFTIVLSGCASMPFGDRVTQNEQQLPTEADITASVNEEPIVLDDATFQLVDPITETEQPDTEAAPLEFVFTNEEVVAEIEQEPEELPLEGNNELESGTDIPLVGGTDVETQEPISEPEPEPEPIPEPEPVVTSFESNEPLPTTADPSSPVVPLAIIAGGFLVCVHAILRRKVS